MKLLIKKCVELVLARNSYKKEHVVDDLISLCNWKP